MEPRIGFTYTNTLQTITFLIDFVLWSVFKPSGGTSGWTASPPRPSGGCPTTAVDRAHVSRVRRARRHEPSDAAAFALTASQNQRHFSPSCAECSGDPQVFPVSGVKIRSPRAPQASSRQISLLAVQNVASIFLFDDFQS